MKVHIYFPKTEDVLQDVCLRFLSPFEQCCEWTRRAGTQSVSDLAGMSFDEVDDY